MKDEEAVKIVTETHGVDGGYGATSMEIALVKAGYRTAMEKVREEMDRLHDIDDDDRGHVHDWYDLKKWLEQQVKKEGV
jgi:hypothetical protein